jgi:hypothetical protein
VALTLAEANPRQLESWDDLVAGSFNGTLFHRRRFLAYHGERFAGRERFLVIVDGGTEFAQIALAIDETAQGRVARSPYGASYGGVVFARQPSFEQCREAVLVLNGYLRDEKVQRFSMTPPIACCTPEPLDTFAFALLAHGYRSANRDLSSIFSLGGPAPVAELVSSRARNMARKAQTAGVSIKRGDIAAFWTLMDKTFDRHSARPTHTQVEFASLVKTLPGEVYVDVAYGRDGAPLAGIGYMAINRRVNSSFYFCQDPERRREQALTLLVMHALEESRKAGFAFFDFGTSTINMQPRENVFRFKESFSKTAVFRETFEWTAA